jgi:hypothetical protein
MCEILGNFVTSINNNPSGNRQQASGNRQICTGEVLMGFDHRVAKHLDVMSQRDPHKVIAVYEGKLVAVGDYFQKVYAAARAQGIEKYPFAIEVTKPEDIEGISLCISRSGRELVGKQTGRCAEEAQRQSQRDCATKPRVARNELPWVNVQKELSTAQGL